MAEDVGGEDYSAAVNVTDNTTTAANCSNEYCVSDEQYLDMIRDYIRPSAFEWCLIAFYLAVFALGLVGNALVCFVVWNDRQLRTVTNLFIVNLAVADLVIVVVCLPPTVLGDVTETWYLGPVMCKIVLYLQGVMVSVSVLTLTVISVERYYAICHPLLFKAKSRRARLMIFVVWLVSLAIILPEFVVLTTFRRFPDDFPTDLLTTCKPAWEYHHQMAFQLFLMVTLYFVPIALMGAAYTRIAICLWSSPIPSELLASSENMSSSSSCLHNTTANYTTCGVQRLKDARTQMLSRRKVAKMLIAVVVMFGICFLPVHLLNILRYAEVGMSDNVALAFALIAHCLCNLNSAINPVIYYLMSEKFKRGFLDVLECRCRSNRHNTGTTGIPIQGPDTRYIIATGRRTTAL